MTTEKPTKTDPQFGQIAYDAFWEATPTGMHCWELLSPEERFNWNYAAAAVLDARDLETEPFTPVVEDPAENDGC